MTTSRWQALLIFRDKSELFEFECRSADTAIDRARMQATETGASVFSITYLGPAVERDGALEG